MLTLILSINYVNAEEYSDITNDIEIKYKWYKETISNEGDYYPLKDITENDHVDKNNIKYVGVGNKYTKENCSLSPDYYLIKEKYTKIYNKVYDIVYISIDDIQYNSNISIYYKNKPIDFSIISKDENNIKIYLKKSCMIDYLLFFIDDNDYTINLYKDSSFKNPQLSKHIQNSKIALPDKSWFTENTGFYKYSSIEKYVDSDFIKYESENVTCAYQEKYIYKYEKNREYYDDNYYVNIEGYTKDINNFKIYYKGSLDKNVIEITKENTIETPKTEYIYLSEKEKKNDSSNQIKEQEKIITKIKTKYIEKEVVKTPRKTYILIFVLIITIIVLLMKVLKKNVERTI